jgi:hypothetical protein
MWLLPLPPMVLFAVATVAFGYATARLRPTGRPVSTR